MMEIDKNSQEDRGQGTMIDEIPDEAYIDVCNAYWNQNSEVICAYLLINRTD